MTRVFDKLSLEEDYWLKDIRKERKSDDTSDMLKSIQDRILQLESMRDGSGKALRLKKKILGDIDRFLHRYDEDATREKVLGGISTLQKSEIENFLREYEKLAYLGKSYPNGKIDALFGLAKEISISKQFNLNLDSSDRINKVISIDRVAHYLHKQKDEDGNSQYKILDELAGISKSFGEVDRSARLLILQQPNMATDIEKLYKLEVLRKSGVDKSDKFWKLFEKAIRFGVEQLSNFELIALREFLYAKI
jgi:hypothetical protein